MSAEWIAFEIFINIVEVGAVFYLLCRKFPAKHHTLIPTVLFMIGTIIYLSLPFFITAWLPPVEIITFILYLAYVLSCRSGGIWRKIFWVSLAYALVMVIAVLTTTVYSLFTGLSNLDLVTQPSGIRFLLVMTSKTIHIVVFYALSLKKKKNELLYNPSLIICFAVPLISFLSMVIMYYIILHNAVRIPEPLIAVVSISYLLVNVIVFLLYERINKEAENNYTLMAKHKQYEITEQHNSEIIKIYANMRGWRHDYVNHMQLIMTLLEKSKSKDLNIDEAINYINNLDEKIKSSSLTVSTGNYIVDAIVSAKMALASSFNIKFEYDILLPASLVITDTDLCSVLSNLLDNAIEACRKLDDNEQRYINFEMIIIRNQLHIKIINATNGKYDKEGGRFRTTKQSQSHGIGMKHIDSIVGEYGGIYDITAEDNFFATQISIPLAIANVAVVH